MRAFNILQLTFLSFTIAACGGGGENDSDSDSDAEYGAVITDANLDDTVDAAIGGALTSIVTMPFSEIPLSSSAKSRVNIESAVSGKTVATFSAKSEEEFGCVLSGSSTLSYSDDLLNVTEVPASGEINLEYDMCSDFEDVSIDGDISFSWDGGWSETQGPRNSNYSFDLNYFFLGGDTVSLESDFSCSNYGADCTNASAVSIDGDANVEVSNSSVSGSETTGYAVDADVVFDGYEIEISGNALIPCDTSFGFSSGSIDVTENSSETVVEIEFLSCSEARVTYDGETSTYAY